MESYPKEFLFDEEARIKLKKGINTIAKAVKSTLGPMGQTVLIEDPSHTHGLTNTKDGLTVAKAIQVIDPTEELAVRIMKQSAERTGNEAGDGTTSAIVLAEAIIEAGFELIKPEHNKIQVLRALNEITADIVKTLKKRSRKVTGKMLQDVATISANNDPKIGKIIADAYNAVGEGGLVIAEKSQTTDTYSEVTKGMRIDRGWTSPGFINNHSKDECVFENCKILVCDSEIGNFLSLEKNVFIPIVGKGEKLLVIAPCTNNVINNFAANFIKGTLKAVNITPPNHGYRSHELMSDIALALGATYFSEKTGDDLTLIKYSDLGFAKKVVVGQNHTTIVRGDGNEDVVNARVAQLREAYDREQKKADKDFILERIASLTGGIGVIYVGGNTDTEQKELFDRVDDSICAVRSALEEGIVAGGGKALFDIPSLLCDDSPERMIAGYIMMEALKAPLLQILSNAGLNFDDIYIKSGEMIGKGYGYNVKTGKYGSMIRMGVIDPLKVVRCALENSVSVAVTILSTNCVITIARQQ